MENAGRDEQNKHIADMGVFLRVQSAAIAEYDEALVRRLIKKVTIYESRFAVKFKSGVSVDMQVKYT